MEDTMADKVANEFITQARNELRESVEKIEHCLRQLPDLELWWRPFESANSIANIILHLCGNLRQWVISGVGGEPDIRKRREEFAARSTITKDRLLDKLRQTAREADAAMARCTSDELLRTRRVQHWDVTALHAIFSSISHFVGHTHQIVYITRLRLEEKYEFEGLTAADE
jgi:uncharacterized damage-inducible protein DinB